MAAIGAPTDLHCEYAVAPLGLERTEPRFFWQVPANTRGQRQTGYRIIVSANPDRLAMDDGDVWDSGRMDSDQSIHVRYAGAPLQSRTRYHWKVRIWDREGNASDFSEPAWFEMGFLSSSDWEAEWIDLDYQTSPENEQPCPMVRKEFQIEQPVRRARAYVSALGLYELYINGQRVGDHILAPEWTDYRKRVQYQTFDVTNHVQQGANAIGAMLGYGWYAGRIGATGKDRDPRHFYGERPRFLVQLEVESPNGQRQMVCTDETWMGTIEGPILNSCLYEGEEQDTRKEMPGWSRPGFDDTKWARVRGYPSGDVALVSQYNEPIRIMRELSPIAISEPAQRVYVLDMGQNMVGWCRLQVRGTAGTVVCLRHAEVLQDDGHIYTDNLRSAPQEDSFTLKGDVLEVLEPHFTYHGFRYVEVTGLSEPPPLDGLTGCVFYSSVPTAGSFDCSEPALNKLFENIVWTQRGNLHSTLTDCPQRDERLGWMGDAQLFSQTACFNMDMARFLTKWVADIRDAQFENGSFSVISPNPFKQFGEAEGAPGWADAGVIIPWRSYENYGDTDLLREHYKAAKAWVDHVWCHNEDLLWRHERGNDFGDWLNADTMELADWPESGGEVPKEVYATCFFAHSADLLSRIATIVGDDQGAQRYAGLFEGIRDAFCREFVDAEDRILGGTQAGYALALHFNLLSEGLADRATDHIVESIDKYNGHISTGIQSTNRMMLELAKHGRADVAYQLMMNRTVPSWLYMVDHGATTIWERWDGFVEGRGFQTPRMNSFNHYAIGAVGEWMYRCIAGINLDSDEPAYKHTIIRPIPGGGMTHARAEYDSIYGKIISSWAMSKRRFELEIRIPGNTSATVYVPGSDPASVFEGGNPVEAAEGVEILRVEDDHVVLHVGAGRYEFAVPV